MLSMITSRGLEITKIQNMQPVPGPNLLLYQSLTQIYI